MSEAVKKFRLEPTPGRVIIRYVKKVKTSAIIIKPGEEEVEENIGEIVAVSERPGKAKVGCRVVYNPGATLPVTVDGEEFRILNEDGINAFFVAD